MDLLQGVVRDYDWGDRTAIADLLGHTPPGHPEAEYWLGAHPSAPSRLVGNDVALDALVADGTASVVGPMVSQRFSGLPFLLKILAAERPLSIQAHPSLQQAKAGYAREELGGVPIDAPNRSYRDDNHKPELICALTPFEAKCGFRRVADSQRLLRLFDAPSFDGLIERLSLPGDEAEVLAAAVGWLLNLPTEQAAGLANAAVAAAASAGSELIDQFGAEVHWTIRIGECFPDDVGVVVALLLNHVSLAPGQAIFLSAGNLHCYLHGVGVELMANSDNVLRGGLTKKHVDVDELLAVVDYRPSEPPVQRSSGPVHLFDTPVSEFSLTRLDSTSAPFGDPSFDAAGPEIILVTAGEVSLETRGNSLTLGAGSAGFIAYDDGSYRIIDRSPGRTVAWRAAVGIDLTT